MSILGKDSRAVVEFELHWQSDDAHHVDAYWADPVNLWRDCLPAPLYTDLLGAGEGATVSIEVDGQSFHPHHSPERLVAVREEQFQGGPTGHWHAPAMGRFYPQGFLRGVAGVFQASLAPCRYVGKDKERLLFDLSHPLSRFNTTLKATVQEVKETTVERGGRCEDWLEKMSADGPGMQAAPSHGYEDLFTAANLVRSDENDDHHFYQKSRLVQHLDSEARAKITDLYASTLGQPQDILDLMASWDSHLPSALDTAHLTVLGLNEQELNHNIRAQHRVSLDINKERALPFTTASFDVVICTAAVEYLTDPLAIFREVNRILRKGGLFSVTFSNRWFPPKAIKVWTEMHEFERLGFVLEIFRQAGNFTDLNTYSRRGLPRPENDPHPELPWSDPVFAVWATKAS